MQPHHSLSATLVHLVLLATAAAPAAAQHQVLAPADDVKLRAGPQGDTNYDGGGVATGQGCPSWCDSHLESLLKFDLASLPIELPQSATLRLYLYDDGSWDDTGVLYLHRVEDDGWQEETVTWNSAPGPDWQEPHANAIASAGPSATGSGWMEFPIDPSVVQQEVLGDGLLSMRLVPDGITTHYANFRDKEYVDPAFHPELVVVHTTDTFHWVLEVDGFDSQAELDQLEQLGVLLHRKATRTEFLATVDPTQVSAVEQLPFVVDVREIPSELRLSPGLEMVRRILDPDDPHYDCAGLWQGGEVYECPRAGDPVRLRIGFFPDVPFAVAALRLGQLGIAHTQSDYAYPRVVRADAFHQDLEALARLDEVQDVERVLPWITTNEAAAKTSRVHEIRYPRGPYFLSGLDVRVGLLEAAENGNWEVRTDHQEFTWVEQVDQGSGWSRHATHVAGTIAGNGTTHDFAWTRGMAPFSTVRAFLAADVLDKMVDDLVNDVSITNHSYGWPTGWENGAGCAAGSRAWWGDPTLDTEEDARFGKYRAICADYDEFVHEHDRLVVTSAGNHRNDAATTGDHYDRIRGSCDEVSGHDHEEDGGWDGFDTMADIALCKNLISVGAVLDSNKAHRADTTDFSSYGPVDDGRIKPDLVANGHHVRSAGIDSTTAEQFFSGTSMAAPVVSGALALLLEHYHALLATTEDPSSATMKAILLHTAIDGDGHPGPDYETGWGLLDARAAADLMNDVWGVAPVPLTQRWIVEDQIGLGGTFAFPIVAEEGQDLRVTLVWNDPPHTGIGGGLDNNERALVNDLDLVVVSPDGMDNYWPWTLDPNFPGGNATRNQPNRVDNVEQVVVSATSIPPAWIGQTFLAYVTVNPLVVDPAEMPQRFSIVIDARSSTTDARFHTGR